MYLVVLLFDVRVDKCHAAHFSATSSAKTMFYVNHNVILLPRD